MSGNFVFGYGSLVNNQTHDYTELHPARLPGWRRVWRHVEGRSVAFLTIQPDPATTIDGLIARVPTTSWDALDQREKSYLREPVTAVEHPLPNDTNIAVYHAPPHLHRPHSSKHPILLSYLDVVVQGYFGVFGEDGVQAFFQSTDGWDAPVLNDRAKPRYSRHQELSPQETGLTDDALSRLGVTIIRA